MADSTPVRRRRPKDRKVRILAAAAEAFSERGYHSVSVDEIAASVEMSGPALYRHYPTKYAVFVHAVRALSDSLIAATDSVDDDHDDPMTRLDAVVSAIVRTSMENRRTGGLYRWEGRYLIGEDKAALRRTLTAVGDRVRTPLQDLRPNLEDADAEMVTAAAISVVASVTSHRTVWSAGQIEWLLHSTAVAVLSADLPADHRPPAAALPDRPGPVGTRENLLDDAVRLFHRRGYHDVTIEEIGAAVGITASSVYRHFTSKADLLATAFDRAGARVTAALRQARTESTTPEEALESVVRQYTDLAFERRDLMSVYFAEVGNLPADRRRELRRVQRANIEDWAAMLRTVRPGLDVTASRFLVHAALGLVFDVVRLLRVPFSPGSVDRISHLMSAVLLDGFPMDQVTEVPDRPTTTQ